ncbi:hypothetical protein RQP46_006460 [Phenoliferia psychrophenolica]
MQVSVTKRESIRWLPAEPLASDPDVDVLVLTCNKYFVDLRVFTSGPAAGTIEWSMGGVCLPLPATGVEGESPVRFLNVIDQHVPAPTLHPRLPPSHENPEETDSDLTVPTPDDVIFSPLPSLANSSAPRFLESGKMPNPSSADLETYVPFEEVWQELPLASGSPVVFLESLGGDGMGKAYTARVGPWAIGLADENGEYLAWREEMVEGEWKSVFHFGGEAATRRIPRVEEMEGWSEGDVVELQGRSWIVRAAGASA